MSITIYFIMMLVIGLVVGFSEGYTYRILEEARRDAKKAKEHLEEFLKNQNKMEL